MLNARRIVEPLGMTGNFDFNEEELTKAFPADQGDPDDLFYFVFSLAWNRAPDSQKYEALAKVARRIEDANAQAVKFETILGPVVPK